MKKHLLMLVSSLMALSMSATSIVTFSHVNNNNDMLFYATQSTPDSQKIVTDAGMVPAVAAMGMSYSIPQYIVECLATKADLNRGNANLSKEGFATRTSLPGNAKVVGLSLPGRYQGGNSNVLIETTYFNNLSEDVVTPPYIDLTYYDFEDAINATGSGFVKLNEPVECELGNAMLFSVPFSTPFIYNGQNLEVAVFLNVKDFDRGNNVMFDFATTQAETEVATVYHSYAQGEHMATRFNFYAGCNLEVAGPAVQAVLDYLDIHYNSLPAFQLDFYTNDIRGQVLEDGAPSANKELQLYYTDDDGNKVLVGTVTTDANGYFEFLNLDHNWLYELEMTGEELEGNVFDFGNNAIENDINVEINITPHSAVESVDAAKAVTSVTYCNLAGVRSASPFAGVNLVETHYSDGTTQVSKVIR